MVTENYFGTFTRAQAHALRSCTKSVTSALAGIAIQEGFIGSVDQRVLEFFPEKKDESRSSYLEELTVEHLLTMSVGHDRSVSPDPADLYRDWVDDFFEQSFSCKPGSAFFYDSLISAILNRTTGKPTVQYLREKLFDPMGIEEFSWLADANGIHYGNSHMELRPIDMARFGYLYLNEGNWNGQQLIAREWIEKSTVKYVDTKGKMNSAEDDGYGYFWWMNGFGGYSAHGSGGQFIFVVPELELVAVFTGGFQLPEFPTNYELMKTQIVPAIEPRAG
jgi:CubicO group peptidase (beta-lactamase class C family)